MTIGKPAVMTQAMAHAMLRSSAAVFVFFSSYAVMVCRSCSAWAPKAPKKPRVLSWCSTTAGTSHPASLERLDPSV